MSIKDLANQVAKTIHDTTRHKQLPFHGDPHDVVSTCCTGWFPQDHKELLKAVKGWFQQELSFVTPGNAIRWMAFRPVDDSIPLDADEVLGSYGGVQVVLTPSDDRNGYYVFCPYEVLRTDE